MQAIKLITKVVNGKASVDNIPSEFGNEVEIIILPVNNQKYKKKVKPEKTILDLAGRVFVSPDALVELENGRKEDRF